MHLVGVRPMDTPREEFRDYFETNDLDATPAWAMRRTKRNREWGWTPGSPATHSATSGSGPQNGMYQYLLRRWQWTDRRRPTQQISSESPTSGSAGL